MILQFNHLDRVLEQDNPTYTSTYTVQYRLYTGAM